MNPALLLTGLKNFLAWNHIALFAGNKDAPLIAAQPPTKAPTNAVTKINSTEEPPSGNNCAILPERICSFLMSIHRATKNHNKKIPVNGNQNLTKINGSGLVLNRQKFSFSDKLYKGCYSDHQKTS